MAAPAALASGETFASLALDDVSSHARRPAASPSRTRGSLTKGPWRVELATWEQANERAAAWRRLAASSLGENVFLDPDFALLAAQHFPQGRRPHFLLVSQCASAGVGLESERLIGLFALTLPGRASTIARLWLPPQMASGAPLLDPDLAIDVLGVVHEWLLREYPQVRAIIYPAMPTRGATASVIERFAMLRGLETRLLDPRERAAFSAQRDPVATFERFISAKRRRELRRQRHRLDDLGAVTYVSAQDPADVRAATEQFLALEAAGWKGDRHTALLLDPSLATFTRAMTRALAAQGRCRVDALCLDGKPIAMGVVLHHRDVAFYWKTAYDERHAAASPGVQFTLQLTQRLMAHGDVRLIDSCAQPHHPMIDRVWPDRIAMADMMVAVRAHDRTAFAAIAAAEEARRALRGAARALYYRLRGERPS